MSSRSQHVNCFPDPAILAAIEDTNRRWRERLERYSAEVRRSVNHFAGLMTIADDELAGEITEDNFADIDMAFKSLRRMGVLFDPGFVQRMDELAPNDRSSESFIEDGGQDDDRGSNELGPHDED